MSEGQEDGDLEKTENSTTSSLLKKDNPRKIQYFRRDTAQNVSMSLFLSVISIDSKSYQE